MTNSASASPCSGPDRRSPRRSGSRSVVARLLAQDRAEPLRRVLVLGRQRGDGRAVAVERLELLGEVALEAAAVLALERAQALDLAVELVALLLEVAEDLLAAGLGL